MGIFSGSHKYYAFAGSQTLQDELPDTFKSLLIQSSVGGELSKAECVTHAINTDQFARVKSAHRYARKGQDPTREGGYIRGLPSSNMVVVSVRPGAVEEALARAIGSYDSILSHSVGPYKERFFLNTAIQAVWPDWDETLETYTLPDGTVADNTPSYVRYSAIELGGDDIRDVMGIDIHAKLPLTELFDGKYQVTWDYEGGSYSLDVDIGEYITGSYVMVKYLIGTQLYYWHYAVDSGVDPVLEAAIDKNEKNDDFLPVAILMQDEVWFDEDAKGNLQEDTELAITTNRLLKRLSTSGTSIKEDYLEQRAEDLESGDAKKKDPKVWDFFIHYAVPIHTKVRGAKEYLWYFFQDMESWGTYTSADYLDYLASENAAADGYNKAQPFSELIIKEGDTETSVNGYHVEYKWSFAETKTYTGEFIIDDADAPDGTRALKPKEVDIALYERTDDVAYAGTTFEGPLGIEFDFAPRRAQEPEYQETLDEFFGPGTPTGLYDPKHKKNDANKDYERYGYHDIVVLTRALPSDPANPGVPQGYERTLVIGLSMQYVINTKDEEHSTGKKGYNFRYAVPELFGVDEETKEFRIPIQWSALKQVPTLHREEAVADGLTATVFLVKIVHVHWYQTGFFKWLLIIIAIVLIVLSIWFHELIVVAAWAVAAATIASVWFFVMVYVLLVFAISYMVSIGMSLMSPNMRLLVAVAIFIAMMYTGQFQNIKTTLQALKTAPGWGTAAAFLNAVAPIYNMGFTVYSRYVMHEVESDLRDFELTKKEQQQQLQDARDGFGEIPSWLDPFDLISMYERTGSSELAESYYARVLNANPGELGYTLVTDFATLATMLPQEVGQTDIVQGVFLDFEEQRRQ